MNELKDHSNSKGGRPRKAVVRNEFIGIKCTIEERKIIEEKAASVPIPVSEYLRQMGLSGKIDMVKRALPKEVLSAFATCNHLGANLNQIARKRNSFDELNAIERAELSHLAERFKQLVDDIKKYLNDR